MIKKEHSAIAAVKYTLEMKDLAIDLFSGIGGVTCSLNQSGLFDIISVEKSYQEKINRGYELLHEINYPNQKYVSDTIENWKEQGYPGIEGRKVKLLHFSPPCQSFSSANWDGKESANDVRLAIALSEIIYDLDPEIITMEQVVPYKKSYSFEVILAALSDYQVEINIINLSDYGQPQERKRIFLSASKSRNLVLPQKSKHHGWGSTFELFDRDAVLLHPTGHKSRAIAEPFPAILRTYFVYGSKLNISKRKGFVKYQSKGKLCCVPFSALARACGFPKNFRFLHDGDRLSIANGSGIGNAFSPEFYTKFLEANL